MTGHTGRRLTLAALLSIVVALPAVALEGTWDPRFVNCDPPFAPGDAVAWEGKLVATAGLSSQLIIGHLEVAFWDGATWTTEDGLLADLLDPASRQRASITGVEILDGKLLAGGYVRTYDADAVRAYVARVAAFDGVSWSAFGPELEAELLDLLVDEGQVYLRLRLPGDPPRTTVVRGDGAGWQELPGADGGAIELLTGDGPGLLALGSVVLPDATLLDGVLGFDGTRWRRVADRPPLDTEALTRYRGRIVAGCRGSDPSDQLLVAWDGATWQPVGDGIPGPPDPSAFVWSEIRFLEITADGRLLVGGDFHRPGVPELQNLAAWDGERWDELDGGVSAPAAGCVPWPNALLAFGDFSVAGDAWTPKVAVHDESGWQPLRGGLGPSRATLSLFETDEALLALGSIGGANGQPLDEPARWDGSGWSNSSVNGAAMDFDALAFHAGVLYAAGEFSYASAGTTAVSPLARRRSEGWEAVPGHWGDVRGTAVCSWGTSVVVGLSRWESTPPQNTALLAFWDEGTLEIVEVATGADINALEVYGDELYVGGSFREVDGTPVNMLASFDGTRWDAVGGGVGGEVHALEIFDGALFVAGFFNVAGPSLPVHSIARWDGTSWSALAAGLTSDDPGSTIARIEDLTVHRGELVVTGHFDRSAETVLPNLASWDGEAWHDVGGGLSNRPGWRIRGFALASWRDDLYVGGWFDRAGDLRSMNFARFVSTAVDIPSAGVALRAIAPNPLNPSTTIHYALSRRDHVRVDIYDARGRHVARLVDGVREAGPHAVDWSGRTTDGRSVASGVYYVRITGADGSDRGKMTLLK